MKKYSKLLLVLFASFLLGCDNSQISSNHESNPPISTPISQSNFEDKYSSHDKHSNDIQMNTQLSIPVFYITQEGRLMLTPHNNTNRFMLSINGVEQEIFFEQEIYLSFGDEVKVKALPQDTDLYTDSEYSEVKVFNTVLLPKLFITYNNYDEVFELLLDGLADYETIYLQVNGEISETTLTKFLNMHFEVGDLVSIKYKGITENYIETEWSDPYIVPNRLSRPTLPAPLLSSIPNQPLNVELIDHVEVNILLEVNGVIEELPYTKIIDRKFNTGDVIRVKYKSLDKFVKDSEWSNEIVYHNTYELKFTKENNPLNNITINEDGNKTFEVTASDGKQYKFIIDGEIKPSDNGIGIITPGTSITCLSKIDGLYGYQGNVELHNKSAQLLFGIDPANKKLVHDESQITWTVVTDAHIQYIQSYVENHFQIHNPWQQEYTLPEFTIYFTGVETIIEDIRWNEDFFRPYINGETYNPNREIDPLDYYLIMDVYNPYTNKRNEIYYTSNYTVDALKDKDGNNLNKNSRIIEEGDKVEISIGDFKKDLDITIESMKDIYTQYDSQRYSYAKSKGNINAIVIPICLSDQKDRATDQNLNVIYKALGKVIDKNGNVTSYIDETDEAFSLSEYYEKASFNQLFINSFVTDWYHLDMSSNETSIAWDGKEKEIVDWFKNTYSDIDMSKFDQDQNGLFDEIIFINTNDLSNKDFYNRTGIDGAFRYSYSYTNERVGTIDSLGYNSYINLSLGFLFEDLKIDDGKTGFTASTLIHEFGHTLGLVDYYDTNGSFSALGSYDMQDGNYGDWNIYSKYSVGWINPRVIDEDVFNGNDTYTTTLHSSSINGDALLIPTRGYDYNGTPFDEYILVEFFTPDGLNEYDAKKFGLENTYGVRIYHVNSIYEKRTLNNNDGTTIDIGTIHYSNSTNSSSLEYGKFLIEVIQSSGTNTLTTPALYPTILNSDDFFYQGDVFDVSNYQEFFYNGLMDNSMDFGYTITIEEINTDTIEPHAVIKISKK